jgi:hypothetical protein
MRTVNELVHLFGSRWSAFEVEATVWKMVADATAAGRLLVDLAEVELSLTTPLALLEPESVPILPDPLPSSLEAVVCDDGAILLSSSESDAIVNEIQGVPPLMLRC